MLTKIIPETREYVERFNRGLRKLKESREHNRITEDFHSSLYELILVS